MQTTSTYCTGVQSNHWRDYIEQVETLELAKFRSLPNPPLHLLTTTIAHTIMAQFIIFKKKNSSFSKLITVNTSVIHNQGNQIHLYNICIPQLSLSAIKEPCSLFLSEIIVEQIKGIECCPR